MNKLKRKQNERPQAFWGALIGAGTSLVGGLLGNNAAKKQAKLMANQNDYNIALQDAQSATNAYNAALDYQQNYLQQFKQQARFGGIKRLGSRNIIITDGGNAKRIGNNTYLLRGGSHEDINETGQTGIGINVGGNEIEAEGGEVAQRKGNSLRIYSAQPILGGISPAEAIMRGYNKDRVFNAQQRFKKNNGIKDDGSKQRIGGEVPYNHYDPTGLFGGSPHPLAKIIDITGITSYGDVKKLIDKKRRGEIPTTQEYLGALSAIPAIGRIAKGLNLIGNIADATSFMKDVKESEAKENAYQNEIVKYRDIHGKIKTGRRGSMPYSAHELRKRYGGLTSKDRGSSKHPYPSVASKDFAGGNRSYPIPTKADAIDALRLAGLHGRSDVRSKVYSKYPELRKKARGGTKVEPYYDWARNTSSNLGISFIDPTYDYRTYYNSVTPYERNLIRFAPQGTHFTDIGKTPKHPTFSNESIYSNKKHTGGTWNGNVFVPNIWQFGNDGNKARNKYMNNSGEGYFNGRVNIFPKYRKRITKKIGGLTNPPVERFKCGGRIRPKAEDGMLAPIYSYGTNKRRLPSFAHIDITPRAIPNFKPVSIPTNAKTPFDPNSVPFLGNQSTFKPATQDYIGLGIDTLAALGSGLINYNSASKTYIPERTSIIQSSKLPTYYNISPQVEEIRRQRNKAFDDISHNTSSSVAAINRMNRIASDSVLGIDKLYATKENEENKMLSQDALNQQSVAAENAKLQADYETNKANILNAQNQAKADAINLSLSGLSQAWNNFASSVENRYDARQNEIAAISSANSPSVVKNAISLGYNLSPEVLANLYKNSKNEELRNTILGRLSPNERKRYGIR